METVSANSTKISKLKELLTKEQSLLQNCINDNVNNSPSLENVTSLNNINDDINNLFNELLSDDNVQVNELKTIIKTFRTVSNKI